MCSPTLLTTAAFLRHSAQDDPSQLNSIPGILKLPLGTGQVGLAAGLLECAQVEVRAQAGPEDDDNEVALGGLQFEPAHRLLRRDASRHRRRRVRIIPTHDAEGEAVTE